MSETEKYDFFEGMTPERGIIRESTLHATNDFYIWAELKPTRMVRFAVWLNGWLPFNWRLGKLNDRWRFFRV